MFHRKDKKELSPVRDRNLVENPILDSQSNQFHIHGGENTGFMIQGGKPLGSDTLHTHQHHTTTSNTTMPTTYTNTSGIPSNEVVYIEGHRPHNYTEARGSDLSDLGRITSTEQKYVPGLGMGTSHGDSHLLNRTEHVGLTGPTDYVIDSGYNDRRYETTERISEVDRTYIPTEHHSHVSSDRHMSSTTKSSLKEKMTMENFDKVVNKAQEIMHKIPQPKDVHVNQEKIGAPIEKAGETYQKVATQIVHTLHEGAHKLDQKLDRLEQKLTDPAEMAKHHERAQRLGETVQNTLYKAQNVIEKVQDISQRMEGKAREKGISPTRVKEQARQKVSEIAEAGQQGGRQGVLNKVVGDISGKVQEHTSSSSTSNTFMDKENVGPSYLSGPSTLTSGPVKVETTIETKVVDSNPIIPGNQIHLSDPLQPKRFN